MLSTENLPLTSSGKIKRVYAPKRAEGIFVPGKKTAREVVEQLFRKCCITNAPDSTQNVTLGPILMLTALICTAMYKKTVDSKSARWDAQVKMALSK